MIRRTASVRYLHPETQLDDHASRRKLFECSGELLVSGRGRGRRASGHRFSITKVADLLVSVRKRLGREYCCLRLLAVLKIPASRAGIQRRSKPGRQPEPREGATKRLAAFGHARALTMNLDGRDARSLNRAYRRVMGKQRTRLTLDGMTVGELRGRGSPSNKGGTDR